MEDVHFTSWLLSDAASLPEVGEQLAAAFPTAEDGEGERRLIYYDTFDWRVYQKGMRLSAEGRTWRLQSLDDGTLVAASSGPKPGPRHLAGEFGPEALGRRLASMIEVRALLPLASLASHIRTLRILNQDEKTVAFVDLELLAANGSQAAQVHLREVRGYRPDFNMVQALLDGGIGTKRIGQGQGYPFAMRAAGRSPGDYSSKLNLRLDPAMGPLQAMASIFSTLLATMHANLEGVRNDIDPEFLHDLRVAVRRTRSGLTLAKKILPPDFREHFPAEFSWVGSFTGPTRDLDVYLEYRSDYHQRLPETLRPGLELFFDELANRRRQEVQRLNKALADPRFSSLLADWQRRLEKVAKEEAGEGDVTVFARKVIGKRYRQVLRLGAAINERTPNAEVHRLRIQGKKLRYAIEFFGSLFPEETVDAVIKHLKKLQNNLGDFNDLSVQQEMLHQFLCEISAGSKQRLLLAAAVGGLMTSLRAQQGRIRREFDAAFADFTAKGTSALFDQLLHAGRGG